MSALLWHCWDRVSGSGGLIWSGQAMNRIKSQVFIGGFIHVRLLLRQSIIGGIEPW